MLVQFTPISALPAATRSRLQAHLTAVPLMMGTEPMLFEGYHLSPSDVQVAQRSAKGSQVKTGQPLFG